MVNKPKDLLSNTADSVAPHEDGALLFRAKKGDSDAISALLTRHTPLVQKLCASIVGVPESERDDLRQEGLIALHKAILLYDASLGAFSTFAYLCVRRGMLSALKKYNRRTATISLDSLEKEPSPLPDPQEVMVDRERCEALLEKCDKTLSEYESTVLKAFLSGGSVKDAAIALGKSEKSVHNALGRARGKLSSLLS